MEGEDSSGEYDYELFPREEDSGPDRAEVDTGLRHDRSAAVRGPADDDSSRRDRHDDLLAVGYNALQHRGVVPPGMIGEIPYYAARRLVAMADDDHSRRDPFLDLLAVQFRALQQQRRVVPPTRVRERSPEVWYQDVTPQQARMLADSLQNCPIIRVVKVQGKLLGNEGVIAMCDLVRMNHNITELHMPNSNIGCEGAKAVARLIQDSQSLKRVGLSDNKIDNEGAVAIASALKGNQTLSWVNLARNSFSDIGKEALMEAIEQNYFLENVCFYGLVPEKRKRVGWFFDLNKAGRRLLRNSSVPPVLWTRVLAKIKNKPELMHYFLRQNPDLFKEKST